ncbi:MAG: N-formylglutamate amidohydrolase [Pseudomonadota bacterium]
MPIDGETPSSPPADKLLGPDEPVPFRVLNSSAEKPLLLVCDHASRRFPEAVGDLGVDPIVRRCHLAWDIGAGALTEHLAASLGATAVLASYSRMVVDCNRNLMDPNAFIEFGDGVVIHGNCALSQHDKDRRAQELYWPYHYAISHELRRLSSNEFLPAFFAIHSFTPVLNGEPREWEIGVLWDADRPTAEVIINGFRAAGYHVGDNEPYSGKAPMDFTVDHHAESAGLPHVGIEIRQDLIADDEGLETIAAVLEPLIAGVVAGIENQGADRGNPITA